MLRFMKIKSRIKNVIAVRKYKSQWHSCESASLCVMAV